MTFVMDGPNDGERITVERDGDDFRVQRHLPKFGPMQVIRTRTPWWFAYTPETARALLDWIA